MPTPQRSAADTLAPFLRHVGDVYEQKTDRSFPGMASTPMRDAEGGQVRDAITAALTEQVKTRIVSSSLTHPFVKLAQVVVNDALDAQPQPQSPADFLLTEITREGSFVRGLLTSHLSAEGGDGGKRLDDFLHTVANPASSLGGGGESAPPVKSAFPSACEKLFEEYAPLFVFLAQAKGQDASINDVSRFFVSLIQTLLYLHSSQNRDGYLASHCNGEDIFRVTTRDHTNSLYAYMQSQLGQAKLSSDLLAPLLEWYLNSPAVKHGYTEQDLLGENLFYSFRGHAVDGSDTSVEGTGERAALLANSAPPSTSTGAESLPLGFRQLLSSVTQLQSPTALKTWYQNWNVVLGFSTTIAFLGAVAVVMGPLLITAGAMGSSLVIFGASLGAMPALILGLSVLAIGLVCLIAGAYAANQANKLELDIDRSLGVSLNEKHRQLYDGARTLGEGPTLITDTDVDYVRYRHPQGSVITTTLGLSTAVLGAGVIGVTVGLWLKGITVGAIVLALSSLASPVGLALLTVGSLMVVLGLAAAIVFKSPDVQPKREPVPAYTPSQGVHGGSDSTVSTGNGAAPASSASSGLLTSARRRRSEDPTSSGGGSPAPAGGGAGAGGDGLKNK